jgi:hypothetical protein
VETKTNKTKQTCNMESERASSEEERQQQQHRSGSERPYEEGENLENDPTKPLMKGWNLREHHLFVEALRK